MKLLTRDEIAKKVDRAPATVSNWIYKRQVPGRKIGGQHGPWVTTDRELREWRRGTPIEEIELTPLYGVTELSELLGTERHNIYKMVEDGIIAGEPVDARGTLVFTEDELEAALEVAHIYPRPPGRPVKGDADDYIIYSQDEQGDLYIIKGTLNREGVPYAYHDWIDKARKRAREAHGSPPVYEAGQQVAIEHEGDVIPATIVDDVTPICAMARVDVDGVEFLVNLDQINP